ncbi:MAG: DUF3775 domain-containing protein [Hyphomicrobiales bacterium]
MLEISPAKVAHIIVRAREFDAKVGAWDEPAMEAEYEDDADAILEDRSGDATENEVSEFIAGLNIDEQVHLVALAWIGRGTYTADEFAEAVDMARAERTIPTEQYLLGIPLLADYLEEGLEKLGFSIEEVERGVL